MANSRSKGTAKRAKRAITKPRPAPKPSSRPASKAAAPVVRAEIVEQVVGNQAAFDAFAPAARALTGAIRPFRADASLAYHNVEAGVVSVVSARKALDERIRDIDWEAIEGATNLALAVCFAASQAATTTAPATGIAAKLAEARPLRRLLLRSAQALAGAGLVSEKDVAAILAGHGSLDAANDCVNLAALFTKNAAKIRGQHPVTAAQIARAAALGSELTTLLKPARAKAGKKDGAVAAATDIRDRLWTLLVATHLELRRLGAFLWVDDVDAHVPQLQASRSGRRRPLKQGPVPSPAPPPAPAPAPAPADPPDGSGG